MKRVFVLFIVGLAGLALLAAAQAPDTFTAIPGGMTSARYIHTATLLNNGKVLVAGGTTEPDVSVTTSTAELYDPSTNSFTAIPGGMTSARRGHTATLLNNGQVLIAGGVNGSSVISTAEMYDPSTNSFTAIPGAMTSARFSHTATLLNNGKVLLAGGASLSYLASAELYDPTANSFTAIPGAMTSVRLYHTVTLLNNGKVLVAGGYNGVSFLSSAELYDPTANTFAALPAIPGTANPGGMTAVRAFHTATLLSNGRVLVTGGTNGSLPHLASAELYDPAASIFTAILGGMTSARYTHTATLLNNGKVLLAGGYGLGFLASAELYDPSTNTFAATSSNMTSARGFPKATLLHDGRVLLVGGVAPGPDGNARVLASADLYHHLNTPAGTNVTVQPVDPVTGTSPVTLTFGTVTPPGETTVTTSNSGPAGPGGFRIVGPGGISLYFEISTTAVFSGSITICFSYPDLGDPRREDRFKLRHFENGGWQNVPISSLDTSANIICGVVTSLSPFIVVEPLNVPPVANAGSDQTVILGESASLDGSGSSDPDGTVAAYAWNFGDGSQASGALITHTYAAIGQFNVTLTVTDDFGDTAADTAVVTVITPAQAIQRLASLVAGYNLQQGIANSLDAKLQNAREALEAANAGQRADAASKLQAFINAVEAQRGKELTVAQADQLISLATRILAVL